MNEKTSAGFLLQGRQECLSYLDFFAPPAAAGNGR